LPTRRIHESFRTSRAFDKVSPESEALFWRLWTVADDFGRFDADLPTIRSLAYPRNPEIKLKAVEKCFAELLRSGLVCQYDAPDGAYAHFTELWDRSNGKARAARSKFPDPEPAHSCAQMRTDAPVLRSSFSDLRDPIFDPPLPPNGWNGHFEEFWSLYPKKAGHGKARESLSRALRKTDLATILASLQKHLQSNQWQKDNGQFIPLPATWLNQERWKDEVDSGPPKSDDDFGTEQQRAYYRKLREGIPNA